MLQLDQKKAILQLVYQLIVSSDGGISERDDNEINLALERLGFSGGSMNFIGNSLWNEAINYNPFEAFAIVSAFDNSTKQEFKRLLHHVASVRGNTMNRLDVARQIYQRIGL